MKFNTAILLTLLAAVNTVDAAGIGPQRSLYDSKNSNNNHRAPSRNGHVFPFLTKIRDCAIELFFGRHPTKDANSSPVPDVLREKYANELVLRFNVTTLDEEAALSKAAERLFLDVWSFTEDYVDIRLHTDEVTPLLGLLPKSLQLSQSTLIPDLAAAVYDSMPSKDSFTDSATPEGLYADLSAPLAAGDNLFFQDYQPLPVIVRWMQLLEAMFPAYVKYFSVGKSYEDRDIPALRVGVPMPDRNPSRPRRTIVVTGGLHGREWISTSTVNYLAWSFITAFGKEPMITRLLDHFDIIFIPVVNPDGFEYTWQVDRLWRKTRQQTSLRYCRGLDLDHAFGYAWDSGNAHDDPCSENYGGTQPFQAVEAKRLADWARNETAFNNVKFVGLVDLHSYSQQILFPYSYSCSVEPPNVENLEELAAGIAKSIRLSNGQSYSVTSACHGAVAMDDDTEEPENYQRLEAGGGSAIDWFYHELRAHFSYQIKLRDTGSYGFLLPKEDIVPTGEELFDALKYFGDYLLGNNGIEGFEADEPRDDDESDELASPEDDAPILSGLELKRRKLHR